MDLRALFLLLTTTTFGCMAQAIEPIDERSTVAPEDASDAAQRADARPSDDDAAPIFDAEPPATDGGAIDAAPKPKPSECSGAKIDVPLETWAWVPVPESRCGKGTPAGFGINVTNKSKKLLVFMMGGGGCYDASSCAAGKAAHLDGYDASKLGQELAMFSPGSVVDRTSPANPFRDHSFVFVPYCTGDFHTGDRVSDYGVHHVGYANLGKYLARMRPTFCDVDRVVLTGTSAGGFGATFNYARVKETFGAARVDLVDDSGPYLRPPYMSAAFQARLRDAWGFVANLPKGCTGCEKEWHHLYPFVSKIAPDAKMSLVMAKMDASIGTYFGMTPWSMAAGVDDLADAVLAPLPNFRVFYLASNGHVWIHQNLAAVSSKGVTLSSFLSQQVADGPGFANVRP